MAVNTGREGPEFDSFPKASVLTTEKLQEGNAVIQSISIDATNSVFKNLFKSFFCTQITWSINPRISFGT